MYHVTWCLDIPLAWCCKWRVPSRMMANPYVTTSSRLSLLTWLLHLLLHCYLDFGESAAGTRWLEGSQQHQHLRNMQDSTLMYQGMSAAAAAAPQVQCNTIHLFHSGVAATEANGSPIDLLPVCNCTLSFSNSHQVAPLPLLLCIFLAWCSVMVAGYCVWQHLLQRKPCHPVGMRYF